MNKQFLESAVFVFYKKKKKKKVSENMELPISNISTSLNQL
jgi:hypothetical protein